MNFFNNNIKRGLWPDGRNCQLHQIVTSNT